MYDKVVVEVVVVVVKLWRRRRSRRGRRGQRLREKSRKLMIFYRFLLIVGK